MPRTTLDIDSSVLEELRSRQRRDRRPLGSIASELLARAMAHDAVDGTAAEPPFEWRSQAMGARVDLEDRHAVQEALEVEDTTP